MRSEWLYHRGKRIFYCNFVDLSLFDFEAELTACEREIFQQPPKSVLELTDLRGVPLTRTITDLLRTSAVRKKRFVMAEAVIVSEFTGAKRVLLEVISRISGQPFTVFESFESAQDWLAER
jgi:hypothetical protein